MSYEVDVAVIGAGVVGLAIAAQAAARGHDTIVLDAHSAPGMGISSRNSEVIHAGIYYAPSSLKAYHCLRGRQMLYAYCQEKSVPFRQTGKLIVATSSSEDAKLGDIAANAEANGLTGADRLRPLTRAEVRALEPDIACTSALLSPSTGIVDSHAYITQLLTDGSQSGADFSFNTRVEHIEIGPPHRLVGVSQGERFELAAHHVFIAGGLHSAHLCQQSGIPAPEAYWLKGNYFVLAKKGPFQRLIYPVPVEGGLGVHVTLDMAGGTRFGPDTQEVDSENYDVDDSRRAGFETAIRRYWPGLPDGSLVAGYAGIRPKLRAPKGQVADFVIDGPENLGIGGLVALHGIESPGLTSSLSLGQAAYAAMFGKE